MALALSKLLWYFEDRSIVIGQAKGNVLFVVSIEIDDETIRIISARKATKKERGAYYGQSSQV
jgi:uncharacterized DUF497 family protein